MGRTTTRRTVDGRGRTITTSVVFDAALELRSMEVGDVLELLTDDFEPFVEDVRAWCDATGHVLLGSERARNGRRFSIEKSEPIRPHRSVAIVVSQDGLEELLSPLGFALAAALEGAEVHLYLQGPAVRVVTDGFRPHLRGWARPFSRFARRGLERAGHEDPQHKLRQLRELGARLYLCGGSMQHFGVTRDDLVVDDVRVVEYLTFLPEMLHADAQIYA